MSISAQSTEFEGNLPVQHYTFEAQGVEKLLEQIWNGLIGQTCAVRSPLNSDSKKESGKFPIESLGNFIVSICFASKEMEKNSGFATPNPKAM